MQPESPSAPHSDQFRSSRSLTYHQRTTRSLGGSRKEATTVSGPTLQSLVLLLQTSSRQTTKSPYMMARRFVLESTSRCRLQTREARSSSCKRPVLLFVGLRHFCAVEQDFAS